MSRAGCRDLKRLFRSVVWRRVRAVAMATRPTCEARQPEAMLVPSERQQRLPAAVRRQQELQVRNGGDRAGDCQDDANPSGPHEEPVGSEGIERRQEEDSRCGSLDEDVQNSTAPGSMVEKASSHSPSGSSEAAMPLSMKETPVSKVSKCVRKHSVTLSSPGRPDVASTSTLQFPMPSWSPTAPML